MLTYLATIGLILGMMLIYIVVQRAYHRFAHQHPELGPFRKPDGHGCGSCSGDGGCGGESCEKH